jgi:ETFB lysine methyltransferase
VSVSTALTDALALAPILERRFRTIVSPVEVCGRTLEILRPDNPEDLIDEEEFDRDERLPYWADLWPSALVLARHIGGMAGAGRPLLELGCGAGLVAAAAAAAGFAVTATDYYEDALSFTEVNVATNAGVAAETRMVDWRQLPDDLGRFDFVIASDVLYERDYGNLLARAIGRTLAPSGIAWLTDPGRVGVENFARTAEECGLDVRQVELVRLPVNSNVQKIALYEVRWRGRRG